MTWWPSDWGGILLPDAPIAELVVRGVVIYLFLYLAMRVMGRRLLGRFAMSDVLVTLLIAVSVRDGVTGSHFTVGDAMISATVILACDLLIDHVAYWVRSVRGVVRFDAVPIIRDGKLLVKNAKRYRLTPAEVKEKLRHNGVSGYEQVREAWLEPDGGFSVVKKGV